jgi:hypothetical protein
MKMERSHDEELYTSQFSQNFIRVIKSGKTKWIEHVAYRKKLRIPYKILVRKP